MMRNFNNKGTELDWMKIMMTIAMIIYYIREGARKNKVEWTFTLYLYNICIYFAVCLGIIFIANVKYYLFNCCKIIFDEKKKSSC